MAKIGLRNIVYKTTTAGKELAKAVQADINITVNEANFYADDSISERDRSFQSGELSLQIDDFNDVHQVELLGHTKVGETDEIASGVDDTPPFVGVGFYAVKKVNNVRKYRAIWLPKVQFSEPSDTNQTKGQTIAFSAHEITGTIFVDDTGNWKYEQTFDTVAEAVTYLNSKAGIVVAP